jgi:hypothetical protein
MNILKKTLLLAPFAILLSSCELIFAPFDIAINNAEGQKNTIQPLQIIAPSGRILAGPEDASFAEATFRVARNAISCSKISQNNPKLFQDFLEAMSGNDSTFKNPEVDCGNGWVGTYHIFGSATRFKDLTLSLRRPEDGQEARVFCRGTFEGDYQQGIAAPFRLNCASAGVAAGYAVAISETTHRYTFWFNPSN